MKRLIDLESELSEALEFTSVLRCYVYSTYGYPVRIICCEFSDEDISEEWKQLNNTIAFMVQAKIHNPVERYNIYLLIFENNISIELQTLIERDRYCCRKIVIPKPLPQNDDDLQTLVENRLFRFSEPIESSEVTQSIETLLQSADSSGQLLLLLTNLRAHISDSDVEHAIDILK